MWMPKMILVDLVDLVDGHARFFFEIFRVTFFMNMVSWWYDFLFKLKFRIPMSFFFDYNKEHDPNFEIYEALSVIVIFNYGFSDIIS